jgi:hypothetical protein
MRCFSGYQWGHSMLTLTTYPPKRYPLPALPPWRASDSSVWTIIGGTTPWLILLLALWATPALAGDRDRQIIRDADGNRTGTVERGIGERQIIRDKDGNRVGTIEPGVGDRKVIRDKDGERKGTIERR